MEERAAEQTPGSDPVVRPRRSPHGRPRRRSALQWLLRVVVVAAVFVVGIAVGRATRDAPRAGGTQTGIRTLEPSTIVSVETVTVTVPASP